MNIEEMRKQINDVDIEIIRALTKRMDIVKMIAQYKQDNNLPVLQKEREKELLLARKKLATELGVDELFVENVFKRILKESRRIQRTK